MKGICITGASPSDLQLLLDTLHASGMAAAKPAKREEPIDINFWHEQVLAAAEEDLEEPQAISNPGRLWEQMASDIVVANIKAKVWGWADSRSTWLLDYWLAFEPRLNFILVVTSPERLLASAMQSDGEPVQIDALVQAWQSHHQELLRFYHRNPKRCLLVDAEEALQNPGALVARCNSQWNMSLAAQEGLSLAPVAQSALALHLAQQLCAGYPQTTSLQHEIAATCTRLAAAADAPLAAAPLLPDQIVADYRALRDRSVEQQALQTAQAALANAHSQLASTQQEHEAQLEALANEQQRQSILLAEAQAADTSVEKNLLLAHLQQLQDELDRSALELKAAQGQIAHITYERDTMVTLNGSVVQEKADVENRLQSSLQELSKARAAHDSSADAANTLQQKVSHQQSAAASANTAQQEAQAKQLVAAQSQLKEATQESELLLLQLHQVQEELEHYFLLHQEVLKSKDEADGRWQRMQQRMPDYCDFDAIDIVNADASTTAWRIKSLHAAGRNWAQLEFQTTVENDTAGYVLARQPEGGNLLAHWPVCAKDQPELLLIPVGTPQNGAARLEALLQLATSDWTLLQTMTKLLLTQADFSAHPQAAQGLQKLSQTLGQFPATLRFDTVSLKREQVNPDYEHLWLCLHNLSFAGKRWPAFEFRVSCAGVRPKRFGGNPKLEFPEHTGQQPFAGWFDESFDDFGAKLELRFALPDAMDMDLWQRLPAADHAFLAGLLGRLPAILKTLQASGQKIKRNWDDWLTMAGEMQRVLALRAVKQAPAPVPAPAPVSAPVPTPAPKARKAK